MKAKKVTMLWPARPIRLLLRVRRGLTLLEILIAMSILVASALVLITAFRHGGMSGESFSAEHFTAMFLAQKVIEDINDRVAVNPHYFTALMHAAQGRPLPVVDGQSPYFRLLENTQGFGTLLTGEDDPIVKASGQLYEQLKNFTCQVDTSFVKDPNDQWRPIPNLLQVTVTIGWKDKEGRTQSYRLGQMIQGIDTDALKSVQPDLVPDFSDEIAIKALYQFLDPTKRPTNYEWAGFLAENQGGEVNVLRPLGAILAGLLMCETTCREYDAVIRKAKDMLNKLGKKGKPSVVAKWREHLARLREQKAASLFYIFARMANDIKRMTQFVPPIGEARLGKKLYAIRLKLTGVPVLLLNHLVKISLSFAAAEASYREILLPPHPGVTPSRRIAMTHHWLDLRKMGLLMADQWNLEPAKRLAEHQKMLRTLIAAYEGRQPGFVEYLRREQEIAATMTALKSELAGLAAHIKRSLGVSDQLRQIQNKFY
ncbi:MAG: hypothetical protein OZSIB_1005 [Candidatus Ozemobacter sibiricus]|uniref:Prepilin-type N-terminal cleavage/methylation domain-containing protein n=1 Tax=Candidatus Ozemobacter sibiricus TaxID=2268124 RepID=A0A367ZL79_9BACT|nr:MAG: hypothetical protein OZSIB_1005 [Candidatus Ozemobacter sibiricus]